MPLIEGSKGRVLSFEFDAEHLDTHLKLLELRIYSPISFSSTPGASNNTRYAFSCRDLGYGKHIDQPHFHGRPAVHCDARVLHDPVAVAAARSFLAPTPRSTQPKLFSTVEFQCFPIFVNPSSELPSVQARASKSRVLLALCDILVPGYLSFSGVP